MGFDTVELVLDIEKRFDTSLPDEVVERIQTPGHLHSFLMWRIRIGANEACPSAAMFYPLRKVLVDNFGLNRDDIRPSTTFESLAAKSDRQDFWRTLECELVAKLPRLERSKWFQWSGDTFPSVCSTVGQLVQKCIGSNKIIGEFGPDDGDTVWLIIRQMIASFAGIDESKVKPDSHFLTDLGF